MQDDETTHEHHRRDDELEEFGVRERHIGSAIPITAGRNLFHIQQPLAVYHRGDSLPSRCRPDK
jgi:hypothetical protein